MKKSLNPKTHPLNAIQVGELDYGFCCGGAQIAFSCSLHAAVRYGVISTVQIDGKQYSLGDEFNIMYSARQKALEQAFANLFESMGYKSFQNIFFEFDDVAQVMTFRTNPTVLKIENIQGEPVHRFKCGLEGDYKAEYMGCDAHVTVQKVAGTTDKVSFTATIGGGMLANLDIRQSSIGQIFVGLPSQGSTNPAINIQNGVLYYTEAASQQDTYDITISQTNCPDIVLNGVKPF